MYNTMNILEKLYILKLILPYSITRKGRKLTTIIFIFFNYHYMLQMKHFMLFIWDNYFGIWDHGGISHLSYVPNVITLPVILLHDYSLFHINMHVFI